MVEDGYGRAIFGDLVTTHFRTWFEDSAQNGVLELVEFGLAEQWSAAFVKNVEKLIESMRSARPLHPTDTAQ